MKVLVLWEEIPETCKLLMVDMTHEEFMELKAAHGQYIGSYSTTDYADEISQALCRWNFCIHHLFYTDERPMDKYDASWMDECKVDHSWFNRFDGRVAQLTDMHTAGKFDAFISTGLLM